MSRQEQEDTDRDARSVARRRALQMGAGAVGLGVAGVIATPGAAGAAPDGGTAGTPIDNIQLRRDTLTNWLVENPTLALGEVGLVTDHGIALVGDGTTSVLGGLKPAWGSGDVFNVWDYGAIGDGITDDRAAIQAAIDTAAIGAGGVVYLPPGTYRVTAAVPSLDLPSNVRLVGAGPGATVIKKDAGTGHVIAAKGTSASPVTDVEVSNMTIDGGFQAGEAGHGIRTEWVDGVLLENLRIQNPNWYGIGMIAGAQINVLIRNCLIERTQSDGIDIKSHAQSRNLRVDQCVFRDFGLSGTQNHHGVDSASRIIISNCVAEEFANGNGVENGNIGFGVEADGEYSLITNCYADAHSGSPVAGSLTKGFSIWATNVLLSNCVARDCVQGFHFNFGDGQLANCLAVDSVGIGYWLQGPGCRLSNCASQAVSIAPSDAHFLLHNGNDIRLDQCSVDGAGGATERGVYFKYPGSTANHWLNGSIKDVNEAVKDDGVGNRTGPPGEVLDLIAYNPATSETKSTTNSTLVALDATNLVTTFTATSDTVVVHLEAVPNRTNINTLGWWGLLDGASPIGEVFATKKAAGSYTARQRETVHVGGLNVGQTYTLSWAQRTDGDVGAMETTGGASPSWGPFVMEVVAI